MRSDTQKTRLTVLCIGAVIFAFGTAEGQQFYFKAGGGYNSSMGSVIITTNDTYHNNYVPNYETGKYEVTSQKKREAVYGTFGKGLNVNLAGGIHLKDNIAFELGINYFSGSDYKGKSVITDVLTDIGATFQYTSERKYTGKMLSFTPSLVFYSGLSFRAFMPYVRAGLIIGKGSYNSEIEYYDDYAANIPDTVTTKKYTFSGKYSFGATTAIGVITPLNHAVSFFTEISLTHIYAYPTKGELTEYIVNGVDRLPGAKESERNIEFSENYEMDSSSTQASPSKNLKDGVPFSSWGINVGLSIRIGRKNSK